MKKLFILFILSSPVVMAQQAHYPKLLSGSMEDLKKQKSYNITFVYDSMRVGRNVDEDRFLSDLEDRWKVRDPAQGAGLVKKWYTDRKRLYEPAFIKSFKRYAIVEMPDEQAKYTLILKTKRTEAGWDVGVAGHSGLIDGELWVVETADPRHVIAIIGFEEFMGKYEGGGDLGMGLRIESAYEFAGRVLGDFVRRKS
ncbi:MAG TPA: hypothetical protein VIU12_10470 [Chryseolinea sp.]